jgi:uncharacterized protein
MGDRQLVVARVEAWVRETLEADGTPAHGWLHTERVRRHIQVLARTEGADPVLAELAALLHDVGRTLPGPESEHGARSAELAAPLLSDLGLSEAEQEQVLHAVRWHNSKRDDTRLLCVLRDADMLDGLGAVGIMRALMSKGQMPPYEPQTPFDGGVSGWPAATAADQILGQLRFFGWLNTNTAREMGEDRYRFMQAFVAQARLELDADS